MRVYKTVYNMGVEAVVSTREYTRALQDRSRCLQNVCRYVAIFLAFSRYFGYFSYFRQYVDGECPPPGFTHNIASS